MNLVCAEPALSSAAVLPRSFLKNVALAIQIAQHAAAAAAAVAVMVALMLTADSMICGAQAGRSDCCWERGTRFTLPGL